MNTNNLSEMDLARIESGEQIAINILASVMKDVSIHGADDPKMTNIVAMGLVNAIRLLAMGDVALPYVVTATLMKLGFDNIDNVDKTMKDVDKLYRVFDDVGSLDDLMKKKGN